MLLSQGAKRSAQSWAVPWSLTWFAYNLDHLHHCWDSYPGSSELPCQLLWTSSSHSVIVALLREPYEPVKDTDSLLKSLPWQITHGNESYLHTFVCEKSCFLINSIHPSRNIDSVPPRSIQADSQHHIDIPADGTSVFCARNVSTVQRSAVQRSLS